MSIASEITSMGENLKKDYQSIANLGADLTNVDKNIENIAELLDGVYDVLPKTEFQEGTEVTLENGLKGKIDFDDGKVGFGQASQESTQGYNLYYIDKNDYQQNWNNIDFTLTRTGYKVYSANSQISTGFTITSRKITLPAGVYTFVLKHASALRVGISNTSYALLGYIEVGNIYSSFSINDETDVTLTLLPANGVAYNEENEIMLYSGNYDSSKTFEDYSGGYASPSPNWEQPIQCVTGNQDVVVSGKNLFDDSSHKNKDVPSSAGFYINNAPFNLSGGTYRFGVFVDNQLITTPALMALSFKSGGTTVLEKNAPNQDITITDEQASIINRVSLYFNGTFVSTYSGKKITGVMITTSEITTYEPYHTPITYPISLGNNKFYNIGTYRDYILRTTGKNLVNPTEIKDASINSTTGDTITYYSSSASKTYVKCAYVKQGVAYTFSKKPNTPSSSAGRIIDIVDDNEVILEAFSVLPSATSYTYTPNHSGWVYMVVDVNATEIQIEEGSTASDYQPYGVGNWYKYGEVGEILLDGTNQSFSGKSGFTTNHVFFTLPISDILAPPNNDTDVNMLSNYFLHCKINALASNRIGFGCRSDKMLGFGFTLESQLDTLEKANTWLTTHNIDVLYPLATPTYTPITGDLATQLEAFWNAHSNTGTTILESNGDLPMIIKVRVLKGE